MEENYHIYHLPVMLKETEEYLIKNTGGVYIDATAGGGGHSRYFLEKYPEIRIIALDCDIEAIRECERNLSVFKDRLKLIKTNFKELSAALAGAGVNLADGILLDLGVSSHQFDSPDRGFSFKSSNLDMRMDDQINNSALDIINCCSEDELSEIFYNLGEERFSKKISRIIKQEKDKIKSARDLAELVGRVKKREGKIHPATKVFQALRIKVNNELENLKSALDKLPACLKPGARVVIISYHSLEDRIVKNNFRDLSKEGTYRLLTKKIITPSQEEINLNPRSRSAKLRSVEKS
ncbi:MAG: 16S rRNA (cytosine(1402)-N(4))-methyltransferase RsmH [Elusimicrobia bacterium]|nr:16S rRNA (cytosine(1402)-N(4))-methyltransferase RsmH [Candidatus Liberimonas magnetica]